MYAWANYYPRRAIETWKRAAQAIDPAVKAALERAVSDWRARMHDKPNRSCAITSQQKRTAPRRRPSASLSRPARV
jgi:hypothetical protein